MDHIVKPVCVLYVVWPVSLALAKTGRLAGMNKSTAYGHPVCPKAPSAWDAEIGAAPKKANTGKEFQGSGFMARLLLTSQSCLQICSELEKQITRGGR